MFLFILVFVAALIIVQLRSEQKKVGVLSSRSISLEKVKVILAQFIKVIGGLLALKFFDIPYADQIINVLNFIQVQIDPLWSAGVDFLTIAVSIYVHIRGEFVKTAVKMSRYVGGAKTLSATNDNQIIL